MKSACTVIMESTGEKIFKMMAWAHENNVKLKIKSKGSNATYTFDNKADAVAFKLENS